MREHRCRCPELMCKHISETTITTFDHIKGEHEICPILYGTNTQLQEGSAVGSLFILTDEYLFYSNQLCIPKISFRYHLPRELHIRGAMGHHGRDKSYTWLKIDFFGHHRKDVDCIIQHRGICQTTKPYKPNRGLSMPLPIPYDLGRI